MCRCFFSVFVSVSACCFVICFVLRIPWGTLGGDGFRPVGQIGSSRPSCFFCRWPRGLWTAPFFSRRSFGYHLFGFRVRSCRQQWRAVRQTMLSRSNRGIFGVNPYLFRHGAVVGCAMYPPHWGPEVADDFLTPIARTMCPRR